MRVHWLSPEVAASLQDGDAVYSRHTACRAAEAAGEAITCNADDVTCGSCKAVAKESRPMVVQ